MSSEIVEVLRLLRVPPLGKLVVEINGRRFNTLDEIPDPSARRRVRAAAGDLIPFAGGYQRLVDDGFAPPVVPSGAPPAGPRRPEADTAPPPPLERQRASFLSSLRETSSPRPAAPEPPAAPSPSGSGLLTSLVEQIDVVLQGILAQDPALARRAVHLVQAADGGMQIEIDGRRYKQPSEIDDPRIKRAIGLAIKQFSD